MPSHQAPGPAGSTIATVALDGVSAELQARGGRYVLRGGEGLETELTEAEAAQVRRHSDDLSARADASGLAIEESPAAVDWWLEDLRSALPRHRLAVLLDTTTLFNAERALQPYYPPSAVGLLDLSVLTSAAVLFDRIVIQPERFAPLDEIHDLMQLLQTDSDGQMGLERIYRDVWMEFDQPPLRAVYSASWASFLGLRAADAHLDLASVRSRSSETMSFHTSWSDEIAEALGGPGTTPRRDHRLAVALAVQTIRVGFNDAIAGALGVPYIASSIRLPVSSDLANRKTQLLWLLQQLIARAMPPAAPADPKRFGTRAQIAAPLLLGLVFERMSKPEDYRAALDEVRDSFAPLRAQLTEDRASADWENKPQLYIERFTKHLTAIGAKLSAAQDALSTTAQLGVTAATGDPGFTTAALKLVAAVKPAERAHQIYLRLRRPEIYILISAAQEARQFSLLGKEIERIWKHPLDLTQQHTLERFSGLHTDPFLSPTVLA